MKKNIKTTAVKEVKEEAPAQETLLPVGGEVGILDALKKHAASKADATRIYNLLEREVTQFGCDLSWKDILSFDLSELIAIRGLGRKALKVIVEAACDYKKMK